MNGSVVTQEGVQVARFVSGMKVGGERVSGNGWIERRCLVHLCEFNVARHHRPPLKIFPTSLVFQN